MPNLQAFVTVFAVLLCSATAKSGLDNGPPPWTNIGDFSGCGKPHASGYHDASPTNTIISGGRNRTFGIYVPESYDTSPSTPRKLILDYHGNGGTPLQQYNNSRYFANPAGESYVGVYPAGVNKSWESAPYAVEGVDDLQFTADLLAYLKTEYCIDSDHVYASGKSNGGGFVDYLACSDVGNSFAAFAMASAALYGDNSEGQCGGSRPRAILESHGLNDTTISYFGGPRGDGMLPDIQTWIGWWAERDGCDAKNDRQESGDLGGYETISYSCHGLKDIVVHYEVYDLGHCWPSSDGENSDSARSYCWDRSLDFTTVVLAFFEKWDLGKVDKGW